MLASTTRRFAKQHAEPYKRNTEVMLEAAALLNAQLSRLDPAFITCLPYDTAVYGSDAASDAALHAVDSFLIGPPPERHLGGWSFSEAMKRAFGSSRSKGQKATEPVAAEHQHLLDTATAANGRIVAQCQRPAWSASPGPEAEKGANAALTPAVIARRSAVDMRGRPAGLERERSEGGAPGRPPLHGSRTLRGSRSRSNSPLPPDGRAARARLGTASTLPISDVGNQGEDWGAENGIGGAGGVERTEGERTAVWHNGPEGFSTYVFSFACALSFAQATNRTLLLAPVQPAHADDRFKFPDLYMDELLQVPSALKTVRIKHLTPQFLPPKDAATRCGTVAWSSRRPIGFRVYGNSSEQQDGNVKRTGWQRQTFVEHPACKQQLGRAISTKVSWKRFVETSQSQDGRAPHLQIASRYFPTCAKNVPFVSTREVRQKFHHLLAHSPLLSSVKAGGEGQANGVNGDGRKQLWVLHLRRGDRCEDADKAKYQLPTAMTHSGACSDPGMWLGHLANLREQHGGASKVVIYVATDEKDKAQLTKIQGFGALIFSDIQQHAPLASEHGSLGIFLTELELLVHASRTFAPSKVESYVLGLVKEARRAMHLPPVELLNLSTGELLGTKKRERPVGADKDDDHDD